MERVKIADNFLNQTQWKIIIGVPLIYLPLICSLPFVALGIILVKSHLRLLGARNIRPYRDFLPRWVSHRYHYHDQITYSTGAKWHNFRAYRWYWIFNCNLYCPMSVALFRYACYLVKIVENWWCPFDHEQKRQYREGAIDKSYWHLHPQEQQRLHPDDCNNPIWNEDLESNSHQKLSEVADK